MAKNTLRDEKTFLVTFDGNRFLKKYSNFESRLQNNMIPTVQYEQKCMGQTLLLAFLITGKF